MASYDIGKAEVTSWIKERFNPDAKILDVGAGDGKWAVILPGYSNIDACEIFAPNSSAIGNLYREVFCCDIENLKYKKYDLIIFGDVIEHMEVEKAQRVLTYAKTRCTDMIIAVPFLYKQGPLYGNDYEIHIQDDLTPELFAERYPGFEVLFDAGNYCYYHKKKRTKK